MTGAVCSVTRRYRPHGEGSASGAEEHVLALESAWSRNAYGARHTEDLYEVMRSVENRMGTITSLRWTEDGAWVSLRTSRADDSSVPNRATSREHRLVPYGSNTSVDTSRLRRYHPADTRPVPLDLLVQYRLLLFHPGEEQGISNRSTHVERK